MTKDRLRDPVRHVRPRRDEVAIIHHPDGAPAIVHTAAGPRDMRPMLAGEPLAAVVPGDRSHLGWVTPVLRYSRLDGVRNGRHPADRAVWDEAVKVVRQGGVAYIRFDRRDYHGRDRWAAVEVRFHIDNPGYHVRFARLGDREHVPDLEIGRVGTGDPAVIWESLGRAVARHARHHGVTGGDIGVWFDASTMRGKVVVDGTENAGNFLAVETGCDFNKIRAALSA